MTIGAGRDVRRDPHDKTAPGGAGLLRSFQHGVEDRNLVPVMFEDLAAFARCHSGDELRAVIERELRVARTEVAGDALDEDACLWGDEDGHWESEK